LEVKLMLEGLIMNKVPKVILPVILTLVLLLAGCSAGSEPPEGKNPTAPVEGTQESPTAPVKGTQVSNQAPDFQLQNVDGQTVSLSNLQGEPVLINFWATWCPPCCSEMPYIQEVYEEWTDKGLVVLAVNIGESSSKVEEFMQSYNLSFTVLLDTKQATAQKYNITGIPTTFFIDKDGIIQDRLIGAFQNKTQIENRLSKIMP